MRTIGTAMIAMAMLVGAAFSRAQAASAKENPLQVFIVEDSPVLVLNNVRLIDGTGAPACENVRVDIDHGKIVNVQSSSLRNAFPEGAKVLDLSGRTVIPGLVGMHEHLFYPLPDGGPGLLPLYGEMADSAPRLYLAGGVTSARTAGSLEPYTDISVKDAIDAGKMPGPKLFLTGPYLEGSPAIGPQLHALTGADDAARLVDYWSAEGMT